MRRSLPTGQQHQNRRGASTFDYVLTLGTLFVMSGFVVAYSRRIMVSVYDMMAFFLSWPFM